ncbi:SusC/RagA family TonB-linked outer membrane protein [Parapedobacter tibetensis]|uniref:SusC/RagA family TonB-linked outer membrane protein n=1 Tax=Parapedobacter tibetensis TaxID=2972951 RepID=UPI00214DEF4C|nr:TonB-dependent receptor [Parapedobacter tibetensis]
MNKACLFVWLFWSIGTGALAQTRQLQGTVYDELAQPLSGVSLMVQGTNIGTTTDEDGKFVVAIPATGEVLIEVRYIGYKSQVLAVGDRQTMDIEMESEAALLEEVVAIGYGTVKKGDLTGSVGTVSADALVARGTTSVMSALQGTVAGVDISSNSVRPGGGFSIQIRGQNSIQSGQSPLYVVDGVVASNIDFLNPADIQKIDVLKDASSTAIYGSRGSNGVVIVTTKNAGAPGASRTTVTYDGYYGIRDLARIPDFMDGREWVDFRTSAFYTFENGQYVLANPNVILQQSPLLERRLYEERYEDWLGLGTRSGQQQNHYVGIAGSTEKMNYNLGVGYQNEEGNFIKEDLNRYTIKLSVEHRLSDYFSTGASVNLVQGINNSGSELGYRDILRMPPILYAYDDDGNLINQPGIAASIQGQGNFTSSPNPLSEINSGTEEVRQHDFLGSIFAELRPLENLSIRSTFLPRFNRTRTGRYYGVVEGQRNQDHAFQSNAESFEWTWDNVINYTKTLGNDHNINVSLIQSAYKTRWEGIQAAANDLPYPSWWYNLFSGSFVVGSSNTAYTESTLLSYAARANYDYKGKYLLTGTIRYDGSSKLRDKWKAFPSAALAWRISEEDFMQASFLNDLKVRFSFGYSGNNYGILPFGAQQTPETNSLVWYDFGGDVVSGFAPGRPVNEFITWEKTRETNLGFDFSLFNYRLSGTVDLYDKLSDGLLMNRTLTVESGVSYMTDNIGSVNNRGIEVGLNSTNVRTRDWEWNTSVVFAHNKNAIQTLYGKKEDVVGEKRFIGQPINVIYDYRIIGLWRMDQLNEAAQLGQQPGQAIAQDIDGDGAITPEGDRAILGSVDPQWTGSFTSNLRYKNWDFSFNIFTRQGVFVSDSFLDEFGPHNVQRGRPKVRYDYYVPPNLLRYDWNNWGTHANGNPQATWGDSGQGNEQAQYPHPQNKGPYYGDNGKYTDASFVKVRNIILGYTLPQNVTSRWGMSQFRVYANVLNPFTFTEYAGWDPEYATTALASGNGPSNITYQLGVNVKF